MLSRLYYVCCDRCGVPESEGHIAVTDARHAAMRRGWKRIPRVVAVGPDSTQIPTPARDLCPKCAPLHVEDGNGGAR